MMLGPNELLIIGGIIGLLFGASKIPELARNLGKAQGEFRKAKAEINKEVRELEEEKKDLEDGLNTAKTAKKIMGK